MSTIRKHGIIIRTYGMACCFGLALVFAGCGGIEDGAGPATGSLGKADVTGDQCSPHGPLDALCGTLCPDGYQLGDDGEPTCACCEPTPTPQCSPHGPLDALCSTICPGGYQLDADGAPTCACCEVTFCGGIAGLPCPGGFRCELDGGYPDAGGHCVPDDGPQLCGGIGGLPCPAGQKCLLDGAYPDAGGECVDADYCELDSDCANLPMPMHCQGSYSCEDNRCTFHCEWDAPCHKLGPAACATRSDCEWETVPGFPGPISRCRDKAPDPDPQPSCYVGGCSGQVCSPIPGVITTCEWRQEYACLAHTSCGNHGPDGACGWKQTPAYLACLAAL